MKPRAQPKALFAIQLKINEEVIDIEVMEDDDQDSLTDRVCKDNRISKQYKKMLQGKIIEALLRIIQEQRISPTLKQKVEKFIKKSTQQSEEEPPAKTLSTEPINVSLSGMIANSSIKKSSPEKKLNISSPVRCEDRKRISDSEIASSIKPEEKKASPNRHKQSRCSQSKCSIEEQPKKTPKIIQSKIQPPQIALKPQAGIRKQAVISKTEKSNITTTEKSSVIASKLSQKPKRKTVQDEDDLVRAYKVVYAKCKNQQMKGMAKKFLQSLSESFVQQQRQKKTTLVKQQTSNRKEIQERSSSFKRSPEPKYQISKEPQVSSFEQAQRTRRLQALLQGSSDQLQQPYSRRYFDKQASVDPLDQPYQRRYTREALANRPSYEFVTKNSGTLNRTATSAANIYRSIEGSPYDRPPSSLNRVSQPRERQRSTRSYAQYPEHSRSVTSTGTYTKRFKYLKEY